MNKKVLIIGPSPFKSKGGMATVIQEMLESDILNNEFDLEIHESYRDGNIFYRLFFSIYAFIKFLFIYKKYDIFHLHVASNGSTFRKILYSKIIKNFNKKLILHIHGGQYLEFYDNLSSKNKNKVKNFLENADYVIALSEKWKESFEGKFNLKNCIVLQNGIDIKKYEKAKQHPKILNKNFLFLGRVVKEKGIFDLIKAVSIAASYHKDICVYIGGEGDIVTVSELIKKYKIEANIKLLGWLNEEKKIDMLSKVNTFILPSHYEALPVSILEAMACGKVIISTKVGAIPEVVINNENGIIIEPGDIQGLADAMKKVVTYLEFIKKCSENNMKKIEESFSMEKMHNKLKNLYIREEK